MNKAVFLDRDGVINEAIIKNGKPYPPQSLAELIIKPETHTALQALRAAGFLLIVVTNQPDVARGTSTQAQVEAFHQVLIENLPLEIILTCYHDDHHHCECRKPKAGLLFQAQKTYGLNLKACYMIGDRWRDIEAGQQAGCTSIWIDYGYAEKKPVNSEATVNSLTEAVQWILKKSRGYINEKCTRFKS